jgi:hypothetical protein
LEHAPENLDGMVAISQPSTDSKFALWRKTPEGLRLPSASAKALANRAPRGPLDASRGVVLRPMVDELTRANVACRYLGYGGCC